MDDMTNTSIGIDSFVGALSWRRRHRSAAEPRSG
jgi:hypothetical protein